VKLTPITQLDWRRWW